MLKIDMAFLLLIYRGGLNRAYKEFESMTLLWYGSFPMFPMYYAVPAAPWVIDCPARRVAVTGAEKAPIRPDPRPLKNPLAPSFLVFSIGFENMPVTPPIISLPNPVTPCTIPWPRCSDFSIYAFFSPPTFFTTVYSPPEIFESDSNPPETAFPIRL